MVILMKRPIYSKAVVRFVLIAIFAFFGTACSDEESNAPKNETRKTETVERARAVFLTEPSTAAAGDVLSATVQLTDHDGALIVAAGTPITMMVNRNQFAIGEGKVTETTDEEGIAHFEFSIEHAAQDYRLVAVSRHNGIQTWSSTSAAFDITAGVPSAETCTISGVDMVIGDDESALITIELRDVHGNSVAGITPDFHATGEENTYSACSETDEVGLSTCTMLSTNAGLKTLTLTEPVEVLGETIEFFAGEASAETSTISSSISVVNEGQEAQIIIELLDAFRNPIAGIIPSFTATGEGNTYNACTPTDHVGMASCTMGSTTGGVKALTVTEPIEVQGDTVEFIWDCDESGLPFGGGNGDPDDAFRLCTPEHLNAIGQTDGVLTKHFIVTRDIDMSGLEDFYMIGDEENPFKGHFDGNHKRITELLIRGEGEEAVGFFRMIDEAGSAHNVILENVDVKGGESVGGLAGFLSGEVRNSISTGRVEGVKRVGGLIGANMDGEIRTSHSTSRVVGAGSYLGGLVGFSFNGQIVSSYATGRVTGPGDYIGGLAGYNMFGRIAKSYATGSVQGENYVGGLVGGNGVTSTFGESELRASYATGNVVGDGEFVGGLVGENAGDIHDSYSTGSVEGAGEVGPLAGSNQGTVNQSYWDKDRSGFDTGSHHGTGLTTAEFEEEDIFIHAGWDFTDTWVMGTAPDDAERPIFR